MLRSVEGERKARDKKYTRVILFVALLSLVFGIVTVFGIMTMFGIVTIFLY